MDDTHHQEMKKHMDQYVKERGDCSFQILIHQITHMTKVYIGRLLKDTKLHPGQVGILFLIQRHGELSQKELAEFMHVTAPSMTVAIQKLEKSQYVRRKADKKDQRVMRLSLTHKGDDTLKQIRGLSSQVEEVLFQNMTVEEKIVLYRLLGQVKDNLTEQNGMEDVEFKPPFPREEEYE